MIYNFEESLETIGILPRDLLEALGYGTDAAASNPKMSWPTTEKSRR